MQNESMGCSEGGHNLYECASSTERGERVQSRPLRNSKVKPTRRRGSQSGNGSGVGAEARQLSGAIGPPALLEYSNDDADSGEDSDGDEMDEEYMEQEGTAVDRSMNDQSDISDSESEGEEQRDRDLDGSQWEEGCSSDAANLAASKRQQRGEYSARHPSQSRKRRRQEQDCSVNDQYAAEVKRLKESKLKHNKNEQLRRKDMKDAVHKLRNQLRRKTKKPSTISVLKAAKQEIDELSSIKVEEDRELERLRQKEIFLKYQLESLVSEREKLLSSSGAGIAVSPVRVGVVGAGSFMPPPATNPAVAAAAPQPIHSRPTLPQLPLFPMVPPMVPHSTAAATSPTAVGRADHHQPVGGAPTTIFPPGLASVSRIPLPRPPHLIPFNPPQQPPLSNNLPSTPASSSTSSGSVSLLPAASFSHNIIPGLSPAPAAATALHIMSPSHATAQAGLSNIMYRGLASPFLMQYHPTVVGRLPTSVVSGVIGGAAGLTPAHTPASLGRISMNPTLPFYLQPAALCPPPLLGVTGFNHYGATNPSTQSSSTATSLQFTRNAESIQAHRNIRSRRSSGDQSNVQHTSEFGFSAGSKNGNPSAEACNTGNNNTNSREASAEVSQHSNLQTIMAGYNSDGTRIQQRNSDDHHGCNDSCTDSKITTDELSPRVFRRYSRNGVIRVSKNSPKHLLTAAPPLVKVVNLQDSEQLSKELIERIDQREIHEHNQQQRASLQAVPPALNPEVISTVIKHFKPQPKAIYMDADGRNRFEDFGCSRNGEQRSRISNSLSSGDEAPDSPHQNCNGSEQSTYCFNKPNSWDRRCYSSQAVTSRRECLPAVSHKSLHYRSLRKKKSGFLRHRQS